MLLEKTQRRLCRLLFVLGCVLPTLAVAGFTAQRLRPSYNDSLLLAAGETLGVVLACDEVTTPRPNVYAALGVRLLDPATESELAACSTAKLQRFEGGWRLAADGVRLSPAIAKGNWLRDVLDGPLNIEGTLSDVQFGGASKLSAVSIQLAADTTGTRRLRLVGSDQARLQATRSTHAVRIEAETSNHAVSADWLVGWPLAFASNASARFAGKARFECRDDNESTIGMASGRLEVDQIELAGLTADRGALEIRSMQWSSGRLETLEGRLNIREGNLARSVVWGACEHLGTNPFERLSSLWEDPELGNQIPFTQLACDIELGPSGLTLVAGCDEIDGELRGGAVAHSILTLNSKPLLREPAIRPLPTQRLVRAWFPDQQAELPATAAAVEMMRALPVGE